MGISAPFRRPASALGSIRERLAQAVQEQEIKDAVRANHDRAMSLRVFGVPTVVVDGQTFWGDDRLDEAVSAARGR